MASYRVVVADDDPSIAELLGEQIQMLGHTLVGVARDGREAVALTEQFRPDLVLMDVHMPVMDGLAAAREIAGRFPTAILIVTAYAVGVTETISSGIAQGLLNKPWAIRQLSAELERVVTEFRQTPEGN